MGLVGNPYVRSLNLGTVGPVRGVRRPSAIDKRPVTHPVQAGPLGLDGDQIGNRRHHGGVDKAVYAYAREDLDGWAGELRRELPDGYFGENLTTVGVDVTGAVIGERWLVGSAVLEVSCPRIPCATFQGYVGEPRWVRRFTDRAWPGAYLRVVEPGTVAPGDAVVLTSRPGHGVTITEAFRALRGNRDLVPRLLEAPQLPAQAHDYARRALAQS